MKENPPLIYAIGSRPTRAFSPRQLPTDHDYAVPTREYQTDQSSQKLPRPLLALPSKNFNNNSKTHECIADLTRSLHIRSGLLPKPYRLLQPKCQGRRNEPQKP
jgi:hypothetical protein